MMSVITSRNDILRIATIQTNVNSNYRYERNKFKNECIVSKGVIRNKLIYRPNIRGTVDLLLIPNRKVPNANHKRIAQRNYLMPF